MPRAEPLMNAVWPADVVEKLSWGHIKWAHADLRVLIDAPEDSDAPEEQPKGGLACHVGIYFRDAIWDGRKVHIGGIGGVSTREDCRGRGYATLALNAAVRTLRDHEAVRFAMLFCEPHNEAFYQARGVVATGLTVAGFGLLQAVLADDGGGQSRGHSNSPLRI